MFARDVESHRRFPRCCAAALLALAALSVVAETPPVAAEGAERTELYFELKLQLRAGRAKLDQWAGGRLLLQRTRAGGVDRMRLIRPLEDPWTLRWYPTKDEVKLGAAVWVDAPSGHPYGALAERLTAQAERRYRQWSGGERVERTAPVEPRWRERTDRFWAARHRNERLDPLHEDPVYPFHVLGDPSGRLAFAVERDGSLRHGSVSETMTRPWLASGWSRWIAGERSAGYGFWEGERPDWEPRTYETLAAALETLGWSPYPEAGTASEPGTRFFVMAHGRGDDSWLAQLIRVVETLVPRAAGRFDWSSSPVVRFRVVDSTPSRLAVTGDSGWHATLGGATTRYRVWRHAAQRREARSTERDELQVLLERRESDPFKVWLKVGYRPFDESAELPAGR
ncbi:MAG: hypothetical protein GY716_21690 [bacterium]|nr:hypothetical protein [bacterium]